jgi:hypothetical protein
MRFTRNFSATVTQAHIAQKLLATVTIFCVVNHAIIYPLTSFEPNRFEPNQLVQGDITKKKQKFHM